MSEIRNIRLVNKDGFHKMLLEETEMTDENLTVWVRAFQEGREFQKRMNGEAVTASNAYQMGFELSEASEEYRQGFLAGMNNLIGNLEVV